MERERAKDVSRLLARARAGDASASDELLSVAYDELRALARHAFQKTPSGTLQPTALVHEAWMKLAGHLDGLDGRTHFFAVAAKAMRQVLADQARARRRDKRGGGSRVATLCETDGVALDPAFDLVALDDSLTKLSTLNARHARVVELRFFGGLTIRETAETLGVSHDTVEDDWAMARAWLRHELARG